MFGHEIASTETHAARETRLRVAREDRLRQFIKENRPVSAIAQLESLEFNYAKLLVRKLIKAESLDYNPPKICKTGEQEIVGLTQDSYHFRGRLGNHLAMIKEDSREITLKTGVLFRSIQVARDKPFNHDWTLSQIERLGRANGKTFKQIMLESLLAPEERDKARRCGIL